VSKVDYNGTTGQKTGPSLLLKVMSGDTLTIGVQSYYNTNTITTTNSSLNDVLNSLAAGLVNTATGGAEGTLSGFESSSGPVYAAINSFLPAKDPAPPAGYPKAYLNWVFLDDQFRYDSTMSGSVAAASSSNPAATLNLIAAGSPLALKKNGYLYIWVSNETQGWDVFFDNLSVQYKQGPVLEENHYYPFGLAMAGISDKAIKNQYNENKYRYNAGTELQNKDFSDGTGLELYETSFRSYDQQIGRFGQIDPLADRYHFFSTYQYALNNPFYFNDPTGALDNLPVYINQTPINSTQDLLNYITQNGLSGFPDGSTSFDFGGNANGSPSVNYDANPFVGYHNGQQGVWVSFSGFDEPGQTGDFGDKTLANVYVGEKFFSLPSLANAFNTADASDYFDTVVKLAGGVLEIAVGSVTTEFGFGGFLMVDGVSRSILAVGKIYTLATGGKNAVDGVPTNAGGVVGSVVDWAINPNGPANFQKTFGLVNDFASLIAPGGTENAISEISQACTKLSAVGTMKGVFGVYELFDTNDLLTHLCMYVVKRKWTYC
jgi:RHS repeat-associated protein